jgi:VanZ family protein
LPAIKTSFAIRLRVPVITLVLAATAIPVEVRSFGSEPISFGVGFWDVIANVMIYVAVGIVLAQLGLVRALVGAAMLTTFAELSQSVMMHRTPSGVDLLTNLFGAGLGALIHRRWNFPEPILRINKFRTALAAVAILILFIGIRVRSGATPNARGLTEPGTLEAHWKFDENEGSKAIDSSGHDLTGAFKGNPQRIAGVLGGAAQFDGTNDFIDFGRPGELRLLGSMTISAWIYSVAFPRDDAAIVSSLGDIGFQLDTTIDTGPRTIGFKLINSCDELMARYGASTLNVDRWYHIAGVYDAEAKKLDVYLDGKPDNGPMRGAVSGMQRSSRKAVRGGRRSGLSGYEFAGAIDDLRIYSVALTEPQIAEVMSGGAIELSIPQQSFRGVADRARPEGRFPSATEDCVVYSDPEDSILPAAAGLMGVLVAVILSGIWPSQGSIPPLLTSLFAGSLLLTATTSQLPAYNLVLIPLTSFAGGASVVWSRISNVRTNGGGGKHF